MKRAAVLIGALLLTGTIMGQSSPGFRLEEHSFNAGGAPAQGIQLSSPSYSITLASIGDSVIASGLSSNSFQLDVGFGAAYLPPREVAATCGNPAGSCLVFTNAETLTWPAERSAGTYNMYRDMTRDGFGECDQQDLEGTTTADSMVPPSGTTYFYLVTAENRLGEEGTKGFSAVGGTTIERGGTPCP